MTLTPPKERQIAFYTPYGVQAALPWGAHIAPAPISVEVEQVPPVSFVVLQHYHPVLLYYIDGSPDGSWTHSGLLLAKPFNLSPFSLTSVI